MDEPYISSGPVGREELRYAPQPVAVLLAWAGALTALAWVVYTTDPAGRVLALAAVLLLSALALVGTVARPRLAADRDGLRVGRLRGARRWPWRDVQQIEVIHTRRLGRASRTLEIDVVDPDGKEQLIVLSRLDLGADPVDAGHRLQQLRDFQRGTT